MRYSLLTLALCSGCFAVSDADRPTERTPEHQTLLDGGVIIDTGPAVDAGSQPSGSPCQQTCTDGAECFWIKTGEQWQAQCAEHVRRRQNDHDLISAYAQECVVLGPDCGPDQWGDMHCSADNYPGECIEDTEIPGRFRCYQSRGPCADDSMCRDENDDTLPCVETPQQARHFNEALQGRCMISGSGYDEVVGQGQIGLWVSLNGDDVCGLATCDASNEASSCETYLEGLQQLGNLVAAFSVCGDLEEAGDEALTCDWRECDDHVQCVRNYRVEGAQCDDGWCQLDNLEPHYLNNFAHGDGASSGGHKGLPTCQHGDPNNGFAGCRDGQICTYREDRYTLDGCLECDQDAECPDGSSCLDDFCRFECARDNDCVAGREFCSADGYCVEQDRQQGGGGAEHPEFCNDLECSQNEYCTEANFWIEERRSEVRRAVCLKEFCVANSECSAGTACHKGRCEFSGLCNDLNDCGRVPQDGLECLSFVDNNVNQTLCLAPDLRCSEDQDCQDDGADCYLGFCGEMRVGAQPCDEPNGDRPYKLSYLGYCPQRFDRCAERGEQWCGDGRYCEDAELRPSHQDEVFGALCMPSDNQMQCNPNLARGTSGDACPLGSVCAHVDWGQGPQWRCIFDNLCDPTALQSTCGPDQVCDRMITGDRYWCINPNLLCGVGEACDDEETCVAGFCGEVLASQCSVDQSVAVGTCVGREFVLEHPFANDDDECAPGLRYESLPNSICLDLREPCEDDGMCVGRLHGMTSCIEGFCGAVTACNPSWGMSSFTGICEAQEPQCNPACEDDETCQRFEHPRWFEGVSFTDCNPSSCDADGFAPYCAYGQYCDSERRCQFGGVCDGNQDCGEGFECDSKNELGHCFRQADQRGCNREGEFFGAGLCYVIATEVDRCPTDDYQFRTGFCDRIR